MRYAQIKNGQKLHLVYEAGEGEPVIRAGFLSHPLCGRPMRDDIFYRMTVNVPLANACRNCQRVYSARHKEPME